LTGTLGSDACQDFLKKTYKVDCVKIPTFKPKKFKEKYPIFCSNKKVWFDYLIEQILEVSEKRMVLVLFKSIKDAIEFSSSLGRKEIKHMEYIRSDVQDFEEVQEKIKRNKVIVATNLAGRGTDIHVPPEISSKGGMHVIVTFLASNIRIEKQAFGRTARKGQKGSGQLIVNLKQEELIMPDIKSFLKQFKKKV
jgi:preprotein translocase subunit SecA